jgi:hypothetical protein
MIQKTNSILYNLKRWPHLKGMQAQNRKHSLNIMHFRVLLVHLVCSNYFKDMKIIEGGKTRKFQLP